MWCSGFGGSFWDRRGPWSLPRPSLFGLVRFSPGSRVSGTRWVVTCSWLGLLPLAPVVHLHTHRASAVVVSVGGVPVRLTLRISWRASVVAWPFRLCAVFSGFVPPFLGFVPSQRAEGGCCFFFSGFLPLFGLRALFGKCASTLLAFRPSFVQSCACSDLALCGFSQRLESGPWLVSTW